MAVYTVQLLYTSRHPHARYPMITPEAAAAVVSSLIKTHIARSNDDSIYEAVCEGLHAASSRGLHAAVALATTPGVVPVVFSDTVRLHCGGHPGVESVACRTLAALSVCNEGATCNLWVSIKQ